MAEALPQPVFDRAVQTWSATLGLLPLLQQLAQFGARALPLGAGGVLGADGLGALDDHCAILQGLLLGGGALGGDRLPALGGDGLERGETST